MVRFYDIDFLLFSDLHGQHYDKDGKKKHTRCVQYTVQYLCPSRIFPHSYCPIVSITTTYSTRGFCRDMLKEHLFAQLDDIAMQ